MKPTRLSARLLPAACALALLHGANAHAATLQMLFESDADAGAGAEVAVSTFNSLPDLLNGNSAAFSFSQLDVGSIFSVGGLAAEVRAVAVPEPATITLFSAGLLALGVMVRRRRKAA